MRNSVRPTALQTAARRLSALLLVLIATGAAAAAEESIESKCLSNVRQVTDGFVRAGEGYFSPDGKRLMWTSNRTKDRSSQLWIGDFKLPE